MTEKKFFRVRLADSCSAASKMINGITLTKQWQVKVGEIGEFAKFPDVEAQVVVKQGNAFVPAVEAFSGAANASNGASEGASGSAPDMPDFAGMTVEQLKSFLIAKGTAQNELRNAAKSELLERAEFIWSQR
jgi:hypothetical protein